MQKNDPCGYDQNKHDDIIIRKSEIICIDQVYNKIGKKIGKNRYEYIKYGEE
jgi:hypothetical protein